MIIAQLSDLHIKAEGRKAYGVVDTRDMLRQAVDHLNTFTPAVDVVIVSGDLGDFGRADEYAVVRSELDRLTMPYHVIPGNHDDFSVMRGSFADHNYLTKEGALQFSILKKDLRIIGIDTSKPGEHAGFFEADKQDWLRNELENYKNQPTMIFMHHPPFKTGIEHMDNIRLINATRNFWSVLQAYSQVIHIACGHVHRPIDTFLRGVPITVSPSCAHAVNLDLSTGGPSRFKLDPPAVRIFQWADDLLVSHISYIGDFGGLHPFFSVDGSLID